jgi:hypothetical protein
MKEVCRIGGERSFSDSILTRYYYNVNTKLRSVVVQFEFSSFTIATEAWKPALLKAMPPQPNIM